MWASSVVWRPAFENFFRPGGIRGLRRRDIAFAYDLLDPGLAAQAIISLADTKN